MFIWKRALLEPVASELDYYPSGSDMFWQGRGTCKIYWLLCGPTISMHWHGYISSTHYNIIWLHVFKRKRVVKKDWAMVWIQSITAAHQMSVPEFGPGHVWWGLWDKRSESHTCATMKHWNVLMRFVCLLRMDASLQIQMFSFLVLGQSTEIFA